MPMKRRSALLVAPIAAALLVGGTTDEPVNVEEGEASFGRAGYDAPAVHRQYGTPLKLGNGIARAYVVLSSGADKTPIELGVAVDAAALEGLPSTGMPVMLRLELPKLAPAPYQFVMFDWNSHGHEPEGVYNLPHFDFHLYTTSEEEVDGIVPTDPDFAWYPQAGWYPSAYSISFDAQAREYRIALVDLSWHD
jgi:hypothetical protein